ncbi:MAG: T9SS type B sorting domain-containing protein, partial [Sphingobacteriales bacterium]
FSTTNAAGCDSVATLILTVSDTTTSTTNITRCSSQLPYSWNGTNYNVSGTYTFTTTNAAGCDSVATLILTVSDTTTSITNVTRCSNQVPYNWNGTNYNVSGTYTFSTTNAAGCDSVAALVLTVNDTTRSRTRVNICSNQVPYNWNGTNYNVSGIYKFFTINAAGCDSVATLILNISDTVTSVTHIRLCSNQLPYNWNGTNYNVSGTYMFTTTSVAGCDSIATLVLNINDVDTSTTSVKLCSNQLPYLWNGTNYNISGTYTFTITNAAGCDSIAILVLNVSDTATSTTNVKLCSNQLPYLWNGINYNVSGSYTFTTTSSTGCDSIATLNLTISSVLTVTIDTAVSANAIPFTWNGININSAGSYPFTTTSSAGCDSITTLNVTVEALPTATISGGGTVCAGSSVKLFVALTGTAPFQFTYTDGRRVQRVSSIFSSPYELDVFVEDTTTFTITSVSDANYSKVADNSSTTVNVIPAIPGIRYPTIITDPNVATQLSARSLSGYNTYQWNPPVGLNSYSVIDPVFNYNKRTEYTITMTSDIGCAVTDTQLVNIKSPALLIEDLFVPKAWSPNGDGHNDKLYGIPVNIRELRFFRIFNRWGQLVFETNTLGFGWDGIFKGKPQVMDVYTWTAEAIGLSGKVIKKSGNSVLLR